MRSRVLRGYFIGKCKKLLEMRGWFCTQGLEVNYYWKKLINLTGRYLEEIRGRRG